MVDVVKSATLQAQLDSSGYESGAQKVISTSDQMTNSVEKTTTALDHANQNVKLSAAGWDKFLASIDPATRAGQEYNRVQDQLATYQKAGLVSANDLLIAQSAIKNKFEEAVEPVEHFGLSLESVIGFMEKLGIYFGIQEVMEWAKHVEETTAALDNQAIILGTTVEGLQAFQAAMEKSGVKADDTEQALRRFARSMGQALEATGADRNIFHELGVSAEDLSAGMEVALPKVAAALMGMTDNAERARIEVALFGRSGQLLQPALENMAQDIDTMKDKYADLIIPSDVADKAKASSIRLEEAFHHLSVASAGPISDLTDDLTGLINKIQDWNKAVNSMTGGADAPGIALIKMLSGNSGGVEAGPKYGKAPGDMSLIDPNQTDGSGGRPKNGWSTPNIDAFNEKQQQALELVGKTKEERAAETAVMTYATELLKDQGDKQQKITSYAQAQRVIGNDDIVQKTRANAIAIEKDKIDEKNANRLKQHANDYEKYLGQLQQETDSVGLTAAERDQENVTIKAAQELQKQNGVLATNQVTTYEAALAVLKKHNDTRAIFLEQEKQINAVEAEMAKVDAQIAINNLPRDQRAFAQQNYAIDQRFGVGAEAKTEDARFAQFQKQNQQSADDYIVSLKEQTRLMGMLPEEAQRLAAVQQQIHATNGQLTADQAQQIYNEIKLQQETRRWSELEQGVESDFSNFFDTILTKGKFDFASLATDILGTWSHMISQMAAQWAAANIFGSATGGGGGGFGGLFSSLFGSSGGSGIGEAFGGGDFIGAASGGDVRAGQTVMVGENGPEVFTPSVPGYVAPNQSGGPGGGHGGVAVSVTINAPGATQATVEQMRGIAFDAIAKSAPLIISASLQGVSQRMKNAGKGAL